MASIYRITKILSAHRGGINVAVDADIRGVAKTNEMSQFTIANEVICARIGQTIGLPIPSGVVAEDAAKTLYYISLDVSFEGKQLPPVLPEEFAREEAWLAAGVMVFDVLIANGDRNRRNLSRDPAFAVPRVAVFDHGHALLGTGPILTGEGRLTAARDHLGCVADAAGIAVNDSILLDQPLDARMLEAWVRRVKEVPDYVFEDICREITMVPNLHFWNATADLVISWLIARRDKLDQLIWDNQAAIPKVQWSLWGPGGPTA
jgi:hypothetical protein